MVGSAGTVPRLDVTFITADDTMQLPPSEVAITVYVPMAVISAKGSVLVLKATLLPPFLPRKSCARRWYTPEGNCLASTNGKWIFIRNHGRKTIFVS